MAENASSKPAPHPGVAALAIAAMGLAVAGVLEALGPLTRADASLAEWAGGLALGGELRPLGEPAPWAWALLASLGLAFAVLHVRRPWRRWVLVFTLGVLTISWLPVLVLMGRAPALAVPLVSLAWTAVGSMIYAARHSEPE